MGRLVAYDMRDGNGVGWFVAVDGRAGGMKIISWNLLRLKGASLEDLAKLIRREQPDLLLMQEVTQDIGGLTTRIGGHFAQPLSGIHLIPSLLKRIYEFAPGLLFDLLQCALPGFFIRSPPEDGCAMPEAPPGEMIIGYFHHVFWLYRLRLSRSLQTKNSGKRGTTAAACC